MSKLFEYFKVERGRAAELARKTEQSPAFLRAIAAGDRPCPPKLAVQIERHTGKAVTRKDLFPQDWADYWPELASTEEAGHAA